MPSLSQPTAMSYLRALDQRVLDEAGSAPVEPTFKHTSLVSDSRNQLRPKRLADMIGQVRVRKLLDRIITTSLARGRTLDHLLLVGPAGTGKTALASVVSEELGVSCFMLEAPVSRDTLLELQPQLREHDLIFLDEAHAQVRGEGGAEVLLHLLEDGMVMTANGPVKFPPITIVAATTDEGELPRPVLDRFTLRPSLSLYSADELTEIAKSNAESLGLTIDEDAARQLAVAASGTPRLVNQLIRNADSLTSGHIDLDLAIEVVVDLNGMDLDGTTSDQRKYLAFLLSQGRFLKSANGTVYQASQASLATAIGKARDQKGLLQIVEPALVYRGFVQITNGGRRLTPAGIERARMVLDA